MSALKGPIFLAGGSGRNGGSPSRPFGVDAPGRESDFQGAGGSSRGEMSFPGMEEHGPLLFIAPIYNYARCCISNYLHINKKFYICFIIYY